MNKFLPLLFLVATLGGCGSKGSDPTPPSPPADLLLGKWQADNFRSTVYDASGKVISDSDGKQVTILEVTPTTMTFIGIHQSGNTSNTLSYTRQGELLTFTGQNPVVKETIYARDLTTFSFKLEFIQDKVPGQTYYIQSFSYHK